MFIDNFGLDWFFRLVAAAVFLFIGIITYTHPEDMCKLEDWKVTKQAEPSEEYLTRMRVTGVILILVGTLFCISLLIPFHYIYSHFSS